ncbi:LCP family protein [Cytobacillus sp. FJAT-54145]|uniref:Regulatory protein MsrR n=1 Tax=Cytobacillus spartinae TaxID=3299023 RepID=A0ABW6K7V9_9BACI
MRFERHQQKKDKKKKRWRNFFLLIFLLVGSGFAYTYYQFKQGETQSLEKVEIKKETYAFNGEVDEYGAMNILLLGSDSRGEDKSRTDTIMVAQYHPDKKSYKIISFMRDMYVTIPGHGENRINTAFAKGGPELLRQTIKENFGIDLQYYSIVDFEGFVQLIDEAFPEGVEVNVEKRMSANIGVTIEPGLQKLDGKHLLGYVRFRQDAVGDFGRVERQQEVMKQIGNQLKSFQTIPKLPKLLGVVSPFITTNMDAGDMLYIGKDYLSKNNRDIETMRIPVDGAWENARMNGASVLLIDTEKNKAAINEFLGR